MVEAVTWFAGLSIIFALFILITNSVIMVAAWKQWNRSKALHFGMSMGAPQKVFLVVLANFAVADLLCGVFGHVNHAILYATAKEIGNYGIGLCKLKGSVGELLDVIPSFIIVATFIVSILVLRRSKELQPRGAQIIYSVAWMIPVLLLGISSLIFYGYGEYNHCMWWGHSGDIKRGILMIWQLLVLLMVVVLNLITICIRYRCCLSGQERQNRYEGYRIAFSVIFLVCLLYNKILVSRFLFDYREVMKSNGKEVWMIFGTICFLLQNMQFILNPIVCLTYFVRNSKPPVPTQV